MNRGGVRTLFPLAALIFGASSAVAGQSTAFCVAAKEFLGSDPPLAAAVAAAFGKATFSAAGEGCVYPLNVLHYATADVLVVQAGEPGQACHGCAAQLSAYVLRKFDGRPKLVRVYRTFASLGTSGAFGDIFPVKIGGDDGMAIKSGGMFQGCVFGAVDFYAFHGGKLVSLIGGPSLTDLDTSAAETDPSKAIEMTSKWFIDPADNSALVVDYKIAAHGAARAERVVWLLHGTSFVPRGRVPPEVSGGC